MIDIKRPFALYAKCSVVYDGRAYSILETGNYLIIYKNDGSLLIHSGLKIQPRNYQGAKSTLEQRGNLLISRNKKETITVTIDSVISITYFEEWSEASIDIRRTEQELVNKLASNLGSYIGGEFETIEKEYLTDYGPVDLVGIRADGSKVVIEVKRRKATIRCCTQLLRYLEALKVPFDQGYLAAPQIGEKASKYLVKHGCKWIRVEFDSV